MSDENILLELLEGFSDTSDLESDINDTDYIPDNTEQLETESENEFNICDPKNDNELFVSKNNMIWSDKPYNEPIGSAAKNIIKVRPGITRYATTRCVDKKSAFLLYFPPFITKIIIENTNKFGQQKFGENWEFMDEALFHAYISVLILAGLLRGKNEDVHGLFDELCGRPIFRAIMSERRFKIIGRALRFDDVPNRRHHRSEDKFAPIRDLWNRWQELLPLYFNCNENVTIDEQLVAFRGRCSFRQFMPSKPAKYGLKFWLAVDTKSRYVWKIQPYLGKNANEQPEKNQGERVVLDLVEGLNGQNITTDNFFTSLQLGQKLLERNLTIVGTVRKNKQFIPPKLLLFKKVPKYTSTFAFMPTTTLVSYINHKNKVTILLSTLHSKIEINDGPEKKPEIVSYYNETKGGVDTADQMLSCYSTKRKSNRWPTVVFANILDISALNAYVLYCEVDPSWATGDKTRQRGLFLRELALELANDYMMNRKCGPRQESSKSILQTIQKNTNIANQLNSSSQPSTSKNSRKRGHCKCCKGKSDIKCSKCDAYVCKNNREIYCKQCK